ncbi:MAG TPA: ribosome silencing factor [Thermomicrobiales bacterium]|jgi:ribosome-associated protein|nr:ribosome silencing factor [Chloroflexota bacterium]HBY45946.1 ribosome silencing factor [Chloroflexota bacterium]HQX62901.1 ribosome silencing factor [Thermomicrobiales bacterium]HQZ88789.1 ribosome silencing factor [Thermomicrobiales bacterium]HRA32816.1 ribosome silencing factor [Thermomicrobiales bacterium]
MPEPIDVARSIAELASDALATNITVLDIGKLSVIADMFVVCSADNSRQLRAVQEDVTEGLLEHGIRPLRVEGTSETGWILLDYGDVVVHLFTEDQRQFYRLEDLWSEAPRLLVIQ